MSSGSSEQGRSQGPLGPPTRSSLRKLIHAVLSTDALLDAFCLDHFPKVKRCFSAGMDRENKISQLLEQEDNDKILLLLRKEESERVARHEHLLEYEDSLIANDYKLISLIGAGGMGEVWKAEQTTTGKHRAIKFMNLQTALLTPERRKRFKQEALLMGQVDSEHVVQILNAGVLENGRPWIAMELLEGVDLAEHVKQRGFLQLEDVQWIFRELCHALAAAHRKGVVHRDLKPENIFIARSNRAGAAGQMVKVLDFGLAKLIGEQPGVITASLGTPLWMAPEQTEPTTPASPSTDVWTLGMLVFWMLCGRHYFVTVNGNSTAIMRELVNDPLVPASVRANAFGHSSHLPTGFDGWFARCVTRESAARFADAVEAYGSFTALFGSGECELFPLFGVQLGHTSVDELAKLGLRSTIIDHSTDLPFECYVINGYNFWYDSGFIAKYMYLTHSKVLPSEWECLGFIWDLPYDEWNKLLNSRGFIVSIEKEPTIELGRNEKCLSASLIAIKGEKFPIKIQFNFRFGLGKFKTTDSKTLYKISIYTNMPR